MINNIELTRLQEGLIVKNYKEMCKLLGEEITGGDSKKSQEKEWRRYFSFEKKGQKYIVIKIYNEPLEKEDKRVMGNRSIYLEYLELLLLQNISTKKGYKIQENMTKLFKDVGIANIRYKTMTKSEIKKMDDKFNDFSIQFFDQSSYQKFKAIMFGSLNNLRSRRLIEYEIVMMININEGPKMEPNIRLATEDEINFIKDIEREVLNKMGLRNINEVHWKFRTDEFYGEVKQLLYERYDINYYFKEIKILFTHKFIIEGLEETMERIKKIALDEQKHKLNDLSVQAVNKQAENYHAKQKQKIEQKIQELSEGIFGEPNQMEVLRLNEQSRLNDVCLYVQKELADYFVKLF
jgi:hypothetical protein